ncbi:unnamed protein product [Fusarium graminearum]|uniref:Chromosome 1, complete genome n=1 Tax=Gibberella zeae (strain ATCC MYA-4620 / CBS 123657 / FGSC 9075 / NRRL 31084 / PH-1) TaxID=229533 RepID=A0A098D9K2_GIBZE|nr:unnamed protein product [Fusarium graminearum]CZS78888.1 unnamed protein product [Fusarium graminearum]
MSDKAQLFLPLALSAGLPLFYRLLGQSACMVQGSVLWLAPADPNGRVSVLAGCHVRAGGPFRIRPPLRNKTRHEKIERQGAL